MVYCVSTIKVNKYSDKSKSSCFLTAAYFIKD